MSIAPLQFTGVSSQSDNLQAILTRAVNIAKLPLTQLQNNDSDVLTKKSLLAGLGDAATALGSSVANLGKVASGGSLSASSSDSSTVSVQKTGSTTAKVYTISDLTSLATAASATSAGFADVNKTKVSQNGEMQLVLQSTSDTSPKTYSFTLKDNSLTGLRDTINGLNAGVTASIFTTGSLNYLSISSDSMGEMSTFELKDAPGRFATVELGSNARAASAVTTTSYADPASTPVSTTGSMNLVVGSDNYALTLQENSLNGLVDAINTSGADVTASIVSDSSGNHLSITANSTGELTALQLQDDPSGAATDVFDSPDLGADGAVAKATTASFTDATTAKVSASGTMKLTVDSQSYDLTLTDNSLTGLRDAINGLGAGVTAAIVTNGSSNYVTVTSNSTGALSKLSLAEGSSSETAMLQNKNMGSDASFKLDGIAIKHKSNLINDVVSGLTFTLKDTSNTSIKVTVAADSSQLSSAISSFVSSYNSMSNLVLAQVGSNAGLLTGDGIVRDIQYDMRLLSSYASDGVMKSLSDTGVKFDETGKLTFDTDQFNSLSASQIQGAIAFFGSSTTGFGALAKKFDLLTDPITGAVKLEQDGLSQTDKNLQTQISTLEERINTFQSDMLNRLQAADAVLAGLESQQAVLTATIQAMNYTTYGKQNN